MSRTQARTFTRAARCYAVDASVSLSGFTLKMCGDSHPSTRFRLGQCDFDASSIPLSNDTVARRIADIAEDVECQLLSKLRDNLFSIQLDEATDSNKDAHFIAYVRFCDDSLVEEELRFCKPIELKATAFALFAILNDFMNEVNIEWKNCVGICTDGARSMFGRFQSIQALVKQKSPQCVWTHCMIHREALASKEMSPGLC
ncbi:zinc finger BED domain-containing protein 5-like [Stegodyphus dumicola]|uniref:zinc finger BED domain-containing protein 5-like n=1 Tax=Stegodyphus dumicola TaxID=202533 RepID=UPI0015B0A147|nr:zinc finger BED domain-containing protein 5-like [Stegodyphus dumicola]